MANLVQGTLTQESIQSIQTKAASKVPLDGMDTIVNDLKGLFERTN